VKEMKARYLIASLVTIAFLVATGSIIAGTDDGEPGGFFGHGPMHGPRGGMGGPMRAGGFDMTRMLDRIGDEIGLTEEQRAEIEAIAAEEQPVIEELRDQLAETRGQHHESGTPGEFDEAALRAFGEAQGELMTELMVAGARLKYRVYSVLTEEQQQQLADLRESMRSRRGGKRFGGGWR
jgi:Spy/CpxP family protein refolding chaperone